MLAEAEYDRKLDELETVFDSLLAVDTDHLSGEAAGRCAVRHQVLASKLEVLEARALRRFDRSRCWATTQPSAAAAFRVQANTSVETARAKIRAARKLRHLPKTEHALAQGRITPCAARELQMAWTPDTAADLEADEDLLVGIAETNEHRVFHTAVLHWRALKQPDKAEERAQKQRDSRRLHLSKTFGDTWVLDGLLDPVTGDALNTAIDRVVNDMFKADWADAREQFGDDVTADKLARTPAQRRLDALTELVTRGSAAPPDAKPPEPLTFIVIDYFTFGQEYARRCELLDGTPLTAKQAVDQALKGHLQRIVFGSPSTIVDVGSKQRLFTGNLRNAQIVRDRECVYPGCDVPATSCEADHIVAVEDGGATTERNGRMLCRYHHRLRSRSPASNDDDDDPATN